MKTILEEVQKYRKILNETLMWDDRPEAYVRSYSGDEYIAPNQEQANAYYAAVKAKDWDTVQHFEETWQSFDNLKAKGISLEKYHEILDIENRRNKNAEAFPVKCSGCGRSGREDWFKPIEGKEGKFCNTCQIPYGRSKVKESEEDHSTENDVIQGMKRATKLRNATMLFYYLDAHKRQLIAFVDYEDFINSWAGKSWFDKNLPTIKELVNRENELNFSGRKWTIDAPRN